MAVTKISPAGWFIGNFLQLWGWKPEVRCRQIGLLVQPLFLACCWLSSPCGSHGTTDLRCLLCQSHHEVPPWWLLINLITSQRTCLQIPSLWGLGSHLWIWKDTNIQYIADRRRKGWYMTGNVGGWEIAFSVLRWEVVFLNYYYIFIRLAVNV